MNIWQWVRRRLGFCMGSGLLGALLALPAWATSGVAIDDVRLSYSGGTTRVVFDMSGPVEHRLFSLHDPERVVIDIDNARLAPSYIDVDLSPSVVENIRHAAHDVSNLRVVLDLNQPVSLKSFLLPPAEGYGHRLVVDLNHPGIPAPVIMAEDSESDLRDVIVAIDAGHGGKDPGAIGHSGTMEKDVVFAIAARLEDLIAQEPGMQPVMIREGDVYLPLRERIERAREHKADLFVSIHADAALNTSAQGSSVYVLSRTGATSEAARWLAERENASDLIGGVRLDDKDDTLARVLMDLSQTATIEASIMLADQMLGALQTIGTTHSSRVEQAGFVVLKSPDIPSVLVETAFISNAVEEQRLRTTSHQESLALAMLQGIRDYFLDHPPPGTLLAAEGRDRHVIKNGETLSAIAERYRVNLDQLRTHNSLHDDVLQVGQVLLIPTSGG